MSPASGAATGITVAALEAYPWPGNVRELKNFVERAVYRADPALVEALECARFNQRKAADLLGLTYHRFRGHHRKYRDLLE